MFENYKAKAQKLDADEIVSMEFLRCRDTIKIVFQLEYPYFDVRLCADDSIYTDAFNDKEPYDRMTHIFYISEPEPDTPMCLLLSDDIADGDLYYHDCIYAPAAFADEKELFAAYDNGLTEKEREEKKVCDGVLYRHILYNDKNDAPVHTFWLFADTNRVRLCIGTPNDGLQSHDIVATVPQMIAAAKSNGKNVAAAVNADFFDMFGNGSPSGLCVKDGHIIANADSKRAFIGMTKDGKAVLTTLAEQPDLLPQLQQAASGLQMLLKDGEPNEWGPLEPFAYTRHPRTAAGLCADGTVILLVADGRIPDYSNGASLVDLALLLQKAGAQNAVNLDGGGSSVCYIEENGEMTLQSNPADLFRPTEKLIREEFNSILVVKN